MSNWKSYMTAQGIPQEHAMKMEDKVKKQSALIRQALKESQWNVPVRGQQKQQLPVVQNQQQLQEAFAMFCEQMAS